MSFSIFLFSFEGSFGFSVIRVFKRLSLSMILFLHSSLALWLISPSEILEVSESLFSIFFSMFPTVFSCFLFGVSGIKLVSLFIEVLNSSVVNPLQLV